MGLCAIALVCTMAVGGFVLVGGTLPGSGTAAGVDPVAHISGSASTKPATPRPDTAAPGTLAAWIQAVDSECRYGQVMYPNVSLGTRAEVATMERGISRLAAAAAAAPVPKPKAARVRVAAVVGLGRQASATWSRLATHPETATRGRRSTATRQAARFLDGLRAAGAEDCRPLRPKR